MELAILILIISLLATQTSCQDVETRGAQDKVNSDGVGGGQPRAIYSQRHLSPHRMMHFGKRPANVPPPTILTPQVYDLYQPDLGRQLDKFPYLLSIKLDSGRTLQAIPEGLPSLEESQLNRNSLYNIEQQSPLLSMAIDAAERQLQQKQQVTGQRLLKLVSKDESDSSDGEHEDGLVNAERAQPSLRLPGDEGQDISVSTRSMQNHRPNTLSLPKAYISSLLYGRQGSSSIQNFGTFNKKAEPKDNFFMHFGRK